MKKRLISFFSINMLIYDSIHCSTRLVENIHIYFSSSIFLSDSKTNLSVDFFNRGKTAYISPSSDPILDGIDWACCCCISVLASIFQLLCNTKYGSFIQGVGSNEDVACWSTLEDTFTYTPYLAGGNDQTVLEKKKHKIICALSSIDYLELYL